LDNNRQLLVVSCQWLRFRVFIFTARKKISREREEKKQREKRGNESSQSNHEQGGKLT
jgi:hypothetical protein